MDMLSLLLLLPLFLLRGASADPAPTYQHQDQFTGRILTCVKCPPGSHMVAHCTASTPTQCAPCKDDHFTELWNYLPRCLYCNNFCTANQEVETQCTPLKNRVCRCKEGFYRADGFCVRHSECSPGSGVQTKGTPQTNTVCERCSEGFFSGSSSAQDACVKHQECAEGQTVLLHGSVYHDTVCGTCENLANGGETLRTFLTGFFSMHRMRVGRMKKFVQRYIYKSGEERSTRDTNLPKQRGPLMDHIRMWLGEAREEDLKKLPLMLKATQLNTMAEKLLKRFNEIKQQSPDCRLSWV
ncbi:tumor necrosis factor receptor superfamily member 6B [Parambassis ranga]|uniref:Tumor necrosis factor receptor superfamily member 6B n=1 Tax=Parambassis ranga TaxID=210632 RepID=A0A6P7JX20_9TELE|nr:tumor necrosis factor receptor superfamily member 6B-like [Parambassis ranga]